MENPRCHRLGTICIISCRSMQRSLHSLWLDLAEAQRVWQWLCSACKQDRQREESRPEGQGHQLYWTHVETAVSTENRAPAQVKQESVLKREEHDTEVSQPSGTRIFNSRISRNLKLTLLSEKGIHKAVWGTGEQTPIIEKWQGEKEGAKGI